MPAEARWLNSIDLDCASFTESFLFSWVLLCLQISTGMPLHKLNTHLMLLKSTTSRAVHKSCNWEGYFNRVAIFKFPKSGGTEFAYYANCLLVLQTKCINQHVFCQWLGMHLLPGTATKKLGIMENIFTWTSAHVRIHSGSLPRKQKSLFGKQKGGARHCSLLSQASERLG